MSDFVFKPDSSYLSVIEEKFKQKREIASEREHALFQVFEEDLSTEEIIAMKFLYAYMSLNDLADYNGDLFLDHVRDTFRILRMIPWGNKIPVSLFLHFVLPYRVNNENIENCRSSLFIELYSRIRDLSMTDAILEVNHWCHERATYIGCDPRTSSPLTVIRRTLGRCGEESTLTVSALRSLCIPARQCYTPRWAHCDDNHAWVEAWADGKWSYLGACEPDARLNNGWFKDPARRAMLVNTRVPGNYTGPEEITLSDKWYIELNLLKNYAPVKKISVRTTDQTGNPVPGSLIHFQVFNSGEFSTIARLTADDTGEVSMTTGFGDLMVHATSSKGWGYKKICTAEEDTFGISLSFELPACESHELDMIPPVQTHIDAEDPTEEELNRNNIRLKEEDRIRAEYESSFLAGKVIQEAACGLSLPSDRVWNVLKKARGNSREIAAFLKEETPVYGELALKLLEVLAEKDLTDTFRPVLKDHLYGASAFQEIFDNQIYTNYVLCPRILHEMICDYRLFFQKNFTVKEQESFRECPERLADWVKNNIQVLEGYTYYNGSATPKGTFELKKADRLSRDIVFAAMARSFGIPARLNPADKRPQFLEDHVWKDVNQDNPNFECSRHTDGSGVSGGIRLVKEPGYKEKPRYFIDFSLARFEENIFQSLNYEGLEWSKFEDSIEVMPGIYRLVTGNRISDGTCLIRMTVFAVKPGETAEVVVSYRKEEGNVSVLGTVPDSCGFTIIDKNLEFSKDGVSIGLIKGKQTDLKEILSEHGIVVAWIEPDMEPSKHLLSELCDLSAEFDAWGGQIILCARGDKMTSLFKTDFCGGLPKQTLFSIDSENGTLNMMVSGLAKKPGMDFPLVFVIDSHGEIRYTSSGYKPGIGAEVVNSFS